jgi:hypothetical protein
LSPRAPDPPLQRRSGRQRRHSAAFAAVLFVLKSTTCDIAPYPGEAMAGIAGIADHARLLAGAQPRDGATRRTHANVAVGIGAVRRVPRRPANAGAPAMVVHRGGALSRWHRQDAA